MQPFSVFTIHSGLSRILVQYVITWFDFKTQGLKFMQVRQLRTLQKSIQNMYDSTLKILWTPVVDVILKAFSAILKLVRWKYNAYSE